MTLFMLPGSLTQAIRNFAKCLEGWLKSALVNAPDEILKVKVCVEAMIWNERAIMPYSPCSAL